MDRSLANELARKLSAAQHTREILPRISEQLPHATIDDAYEIQAAWVEEQLDAERKLVGHKIGLTARAAQDRRGITEPTHGTIFRDQIFDNSSLIDFDMFHNPRVEVELAFILKDRLEGPHVTMYDVLRATEFITPALEILAPRIAGPGRTVVDSVADNSYFGAMILGGRPLRPEDVDMRWVSALLYKNEVIEETGVAAGVLNHPANGVAWLANTLGARDQALDAGEIILAGSFTRSMPVERGDVILCDYGRMGTISARFV
ncbi:2-oxo-hepta-3-ene-1,7-dioate hydratase [Arcanobacterium phocisimile]|uniref:2-oxo-hepta-3-ene-1,7-dioate hydratase n=1 Tax=Arcanobacterium phocisimile TaxID=1302235 RepID=A0ABX7IFI6_9ACTO|nr:2-oxo-hepta-3-ene-1,7-dioate hydratase [Arcanobacterium phocisimile]QRV01896.1 2-oxo-hepta-3-ene-1,7-dioate hydratase [Arcanobacterium phocisimile]